MTLTPDIQKKVTFLAETDDDLLHLFAPMDRAVIVALKVMEKQKKNAEMQMSVSNETVSVLDS